MHIAQKIMPHKDKGCFWNCPGEATKKFLLPSCLMYLKKLYTSTATDWTHLHAWQLFNSNLTASVRMQQTANHLLTSMTWIGHASFFMKIGDCSILADPLFDKLTPLFPRYQAPSMTREALPPIDVVIISHNHWDHLEKATVVHLARQHNPLFLVPYGDKKTLIKWGISRVHEHMWWDTYIHTSNVTQQQTTFTFLPAYHWSGRGLFDTNRSLWGSWMISAQNYYCYFAGDTGYSTHFKDIAHYFPTIHTALMPIGPCEPHKYLRQSHINAEEAGQAFVELGAQHFIPMHWGTFGFGTDTPLAPLRRLEAWWQHSMSTSQRQLIPLRVGQKLSLQPVSDILQSTTGHIRPTPSL